MEIIIIITVLALAFAFREKIFEELRLIRKQDAAVLYEDLIFEYFFPMTGKERADAFEEYIGEMKALQEKVAQSLVAKYFIDYQEDIAKHEKDLAERRRSYKRKEDMYTFTTLTANNIIADMRYTKEQLEHISQIIDDIFPEEEDAGLYRIDWKDGARFIDVSLFEVKEPFEVDRYQTFANAVAEEVFDGKGVVLHLSQPGSDFHEVIKSSL